MQFTIRGLECDVLLVHLKLFCLNPEVMKLGGEGQNLGVGVFQGLKVDKLQLESFLNKILLTHGNKGSSPVAVESVSRFDGLVTFFSCVLLFSCHPPPHKVIQAWKCTWNYKQLM